MKVNCWQNRGPCLPRAFVSQMRNSRTIKEYKAAGDSQRPTMRKPAGVKLVGFLRAIHESPPTIASLFGAARGRLFFVYGQWMIALVGKIC